MSLGGGDESEAFKIRWFKTVLRASLPATDLRRAVESSYTVKG